MWQHPQSRSVSVIGRLTYDGRTYRFVYTQGALRIPGFRPLPGFRDLSASYAAHELFPVFAQRVMDPRRPDYQRYLERLGLEPSESSPWEQIVHSGGSREGDTLQFKEAPRPVDGRVTVTFLAAGLRHIPGSRRTVDHVENLVSAEQHAQALNQLRENDGLWLRAEQGNPKNEAATLIATREGVLLGYVPDALCSGMRRLMERGNAEARVARVNGPDAPAHLRLVVTVWAPASGEVVWDPDGSWAPLA